MPRFAPVLQRERLCTRCNHAPCPAVTPSPGRLPAPRGTTPAQRTLMQHTSQFSATRWDSPAPQQTAALSCPASTDRARNEATTSGVPDGLRLLVLRNRRDTSTRPPARRPLRVTRPAANPLSARSITVPAAQMVLAVLAMRSGLPDRCAATTPGVGMPWRSVRARSSCSRGRRGTPHRCAARPARFRGRARSRSGTPQPRSPADRPAAPVAVGVGGCAGRGSRSALGRWSAARGRRGTGAPLPALADLPGLQIGQGQGVGAHVVTDRGAGVDGCRGAAGTDSTFVTSGQRR